MRPLAAISAGILAILPVQVLAQGCAAEGDPHDMSAEEVSELYRCFEASLAAGYAHAGNKIAEDYRNWQVTSTRPAVAGPHGERFLQTFANDIAAPQYLKFEEKGFVMPVGSVLAKESFTIENGEAAAGPLFIMTKLAEGAAPNAGDLRYDALLPNRNAMNIQQGFCADCHLGWDYRDSLAYPLEEVRRSDQ